MYLKPLLVALILFCSVFGGAQTVAETKPTEAEEKLRKDAIAFLRETLADVNAMRSLENRISFTADLAGLMWFHDEREARAMYTGVINDFKDLLTKYDAQMNAFGVEDVSEPQLEPTYLTLFGDPSDKTRLLHKYSAALGVRQQIATSMAEHDPDLAFGFYYDSLSAITNAELMKQHETRDSWFEHQLLTQMADKHPGKAAKYGIRSLEDGVDSQHLELLRKIHAKDADKGVEFAEAILGRLKNPNPAGEHFYMLNSVIEFGEETVEASRKPGGKRAVYTNAQLREMAEMLAQSILSRADSDSFEGIAYVDTVQRYLPGRAAQIRTKYKSIAGGEVDYQLPTNVKWAASNMNANSNVAYAVGVAVNSNSNVAGGRAAEEREKAEKKFAEEMQSLENKQLPKAERERIITQARKIIMQTPGRDKKLANLSVLAAQVAKAGDKELAAEIMRDAEKLVNPAPKNYQDFMLSWMLASGLASADPDKAFPLLEDVIYRANDTLAAFVKVGEFIDVAEETIQDGEVQVGAFGGRMVSGLTRELVMADATIGVLARADFTKTKNLTQRFDRPEIRVLAKMMVLRAILGPKDAKKAELVADDLKD